MAVTIVILFHAGFEWAIGGYVGVDVFFVISGFLITYSLMEKEENRSLGKFYIRRLRRLFPAMLVTVLVTAIASYIIKDPAGFALDAKSAIYAILSISNIGFWLESGYWDTSSEFKPLLHTWSLGVEEQFYLVWPALMIVLIKGGKKLVLGSMLLLTLGGLAVSHFYSLQYPSAVFYLTPFRAYQFAIGGTFAAILVVLGRTHLVKNGLLGDLLIIIGAAAIIAPTLIFTGEPSYLGAMASIPCFGALLIIIAGPGKFIGKLFTNPVSVALGKWSYSLYLVHWPIMALYHYQVVRDFTLIEQLVMIAATLISGIILFYLIEERFRRPVATESNSPLSGAAFGFASAGFALVLTFVTANAWAVGGFAKPAFLASASSEIDFEKASRFEKFADIKPECANDPAKCLKPHPRKTNILVIGDSFAIYGLNSIAEVFPRAHLNYFGMAGCAMLYGADQEYYDFAGEARGKRCLDFADELYAKTDELSKMDAIVIYLGWSSKKFGLLPQTVEYFKSVSDAKIIVMGPGVEWTEDLPLIIRSQNLTPRNPVVPDEFIDKRQIELAVEMEEWAKTQDVIWADTMGFYCDGEVCKAFTSDGAPMSSDHAHPYLHTAKQIGQYMKDNGLAAALD